ncbi:MAG: SDR family NAD(P)-dependent oxidoreductase, partial [Pseudomonadota bacterium]
MIKSASAPTELAHLVCAGMVERGFGRILLVASLAALVPAGPGHTLYAGAKSYLVKFAEALHGEMASHGV